MADITVVPKRIGGSLHVIIPAETARREGIREGVPVRISISAAGKPKALGLLKGRLAYEPFDRRSEGDWPDA